MKRSFLLVVAVALALGLSSCKNIGSTRETASNVTGEVWYVKTVGFLGMIFKYQVFYCYPTATKGPATCKAAKVYLEGEVAPAQIGKPQTAEEASPQRQQRSYVAAESVGPESEPGSLDEEEGGQAPAKSGKAKARRKGN